MKELSRYYVQIRIMKEGGEIKGILKLRMKFRHFWRDLKEELGRDK